MMMILSPMASSAPPYDPSADLNALRPMLDGKTGSAQALTDNFSDPMLQGGNISSMDGTSSFQSQMSCPNAPAFLEVLALPGRNGDIETLSIKQDTDFDGTFDAVLNPGIRLSGVCANGGISCDAGTWNNCVAHEWVIQASGTPDLVPTALSRLGGCYCINDSCGSALMVVNAAEVMGHLGAGIVAKISENNPTLSVSSIQVNNTMITYTGVITDDCGQTGNTGQQAFYSDPTALQATGVSTASINQTYQSLATGSFATGTTTSIQHCEMNRNITIDDVSVTDVVLYNSGAGHLVPCGPGCLQMALGTVSDNNLIGGTCGLFEEQVSFWVAHPDRILSATLLQAKFDDHIQISNNNQIVWAHEPAWTDLSADSYPPSTFWQPLNAPVFFTVPYPKWWYTSYPICERNTNWDVSMNVDFTSILKQQGAHNFRIRVAVSGGGEGYAFAKVMVDESCKLNADVINSTCNQLQQNPDCRLKREIVDGITVLEDYLPTGLTPLGSTQAIVGQQCTLQATRNWWKKSRTYECQTASPYDYQGALQRKAVVGDSVTATQYEDYRQDEHGNWQRVTGGTMALPPAPTLDTCEHTCKTVKSEEADSVAGMGSAMSQRTIPNTNDYTYYVCQQGVCPAGPGETIVTPCGCMDEFNEATAQMQANRLGAKDLLCTSGTPSPLQ